MIVPYVHLTDEGEFMITTIILYDTALCNLNCRYCFISKNEAMLALDKEIAESFADPNYYYNLAKEYTDSDLSQIKRIEVWGGEPLLYLERTYNFIEQIINTSSCFEEIVFSSNYCHNKVIPSLKGLVELFQKYPERKFKIVSQISCDGPPEINDLSRGQGVTQRILDNFYYLMENQYFLKDSTHIRISLTIKGTLDAISVKKFLSKDYNIYYYKYIEDNFFDKFEQYKNNYITLMLPKPNLAVPAEYTQEDGKILAQIVKLQREIEEENKVNKIFKYYKNITFFDRNRNFYYEKEADYSYCGGFCGTGIHSIGLLPNGQGCGCHRTFADYSLDYTSKFNQGIRNDSTIITSQDFANTNYLIFHNKEEFDNHQRRMQTYYSSDCDICQSTALLSVQANELRTLAYCGLVEEKYKDIEIATGAVKTLTRNLPLCLVDNLINCHLPMSLSNYQFKLFCNGALEPIFNNFDKEGKSDE